MNQPRLVPAEARPRRAPRPSRLRRLAPLAAWLLLAACGGRAASPAGTLPTGTPAVEHRSAGATEPAGLATATAVPAIPAPALANATYSGILDTPITLVGGRYEGPPAGADPARPTIELVEGAELSGDLDGDGAPDAVVFLVERGGGSGAFTYVAAQRNDAGQPVDTGAVRIEDRIQVRSAGVQDGQIVLDLVLPGPDDTACCPTHKARKTYALQGGRLAEVAGSEQAQGRVSAADLDGTDWKLVDLGAGQPGLDGTTLTAAFHGTEISGSDGCGPYTARFTPGSPNPFAMTTDAVTANHPDCANAVAARQAAYFGALAGVRQWAYDFGKLALYYGDGQDGGRLLFAPRAPASAATPASDATP